MLIISKLKQTNNNLKKIKRPYSWIPVYNLLTVSFLTTILYRNENEEINILSNCIYIWFCIVKYGLKINMTIFLI